MKTHGYTKTRTHRIWVQMRRRCRDPRANGYQNYGGRGIKVCDRWNDSFEAFLEDMGECPEGMSIERRENSKGYEPGNCVWATLEEQNNNRRNNVFLEHNGRKLTIRQWSRELEVNFQTLHSRHRRGLPVVEILAPLNRQKGFRKERHTKKQQRIEVDGEPKSVRQAAIDAGLKYATVYRRLKAGYTVQQALQTTSLKTGVPL